jgi:hypothetical protein
VKTSNKKKVPNRAGAVAGDPRVQTPNRVADKASTVPAAANTAPKGPDQNVAAQQLPGETPKWPSLERQSNQKCLQAASIGKLEVQGIETGIGPSRRPCASIKGVNRRHLDRSNRCCSRR